MPISLKKVNGGGGTPIGSYVNFHEWLPFDIEQDGSRYLKSGYVETDTSKFDNNIFAETVGTYYKDGVVLPAATSEDDYVVAAADNGTNTIVAIRGVTGSATQFYVSTNSGTTWQVVSIAVGSVRANDIIWVSSLSLFVAVLNSGLIITSPNGTTWTTRYNVAGDGNITGITFGAGRLVAVSNGNKVITSTNGTSWAYAATVPVTTGLIDVAFGAGKFVAAALSNQSLTSTDGITWTLLNMGLLSNVSLTGITFGNGIFVASSTGVYTSTNPVGIFSSVDGVTWVLVNTTLSVIALLGAKTRFNYIGGFWFYKDNSVFRSKNLNVFSQLYLIIGSQPQARNLITYNLSKWFMFRHEGTTTVTSTVVYYGNNFMYAGAIRPMFSVPTIGANAVDSSQRLIAYMRVS